MEVLTLYHLFLLFVYSLFTSCTDITVIDAYPTPLYREQFHQAGFSDQNLSLRIGQILLSLKTNFGEQFVTDYFPPQITPAQFATIFESLIEYASLRKKTIEDQFGTPKWKQIILNITKHGLNLSYIAHSFGKDTLKKLIEMGIQVHYGKYPEAFPFLTPDHHHIHPKAREMPDNQIPLVHLERRKNVPDADFFDQLDVLYHINQETRIFSEVCEGVCIKVLKNETNQWIAGKPGCWWIPPPRLFVAAKTLQSKLDKDKIIEVYCI